jgi:hypothetical protein
MIDIIKNAYELTKKHALILIGALLGVFVISMIFGFITAAFAAIPFMDLIANIISLIFQLYLSVALVKLGFAIIDGKEPEFSDIKPAFSEVIKYLSSSLLVTLIFLVVFMVSVFFMGAIGVINESITAMLSDIFLNQTNISKYAPEEIAYGFGVLLLIAVPALLLYLRLQFANYIVIDKPHETAFSAVMRSANISKGYLWYLVLMVLSIVLLNIIGVLLFLVGLLFTIPMSFVMLLLMYRTLEQNYEEENTEASIQE